MVPTNTLPNDILVKIALDRSMSMSIGTKSIVWNLFAWASSPMTLVISINEGGLIMRVRNK